MKRWIFWFTILVIVASCKKEKSIIKDNYVYVGQYDENKMNKVEINYSFPVDVINQSVLYFDFNTDGIVDITMLYRCFQNIQFKHHYISFIFNHSATIYETVDYHHGDIMIDTIYKNMKTTVSLFSKNTKITKDTLWSLNSSMYLYEYGATYDVHWGYGTYGNNTATDKYMVFLTSNDNDSFLGWIKLSYFFGDGSNFCNIHEYCIQK